MMKLYFSPLACSLSSRIAFYEAGADVQFVQVDDKTKRTSEGADYFAVSALGLVPALALDDGQLLTENAAILQYIATHFPEAKLAPTDALGRSRVQQWLSFVGTELHKALYVPLLDPKAPDGAKVYALSKAGSRLTWLASKLQGSEFALGSFSVVDAYLFTILNWSMAAPVDLKPWSAITSYQARVLARPAVARAFEEERALYFKDRAPR
jgi:glutathione S-transferase